MLLLVRLFDVKTLFEVLFDELFDVLNTLPPVVLPLPNMLLLDEYVLLLVELY